MANIPIYIETLRSFDEPATVREVHERAVKLFGEKVRGDRTSARQSLDRFVLHGKVEKIGSKYLLSAAAADPVSELQGKLAMVEAERDRLLQVNYELQLKIAQLSREA